MDYHLTQIHYDPTHLYGDTPVGNNPQGSKLKPLTDKFIELVQSDLFKDFIQKQFQTTGTIDLDFRIEKDDIVFIQTQSGTEYHLKTLQNQANRVGAAAQKILTEAKKLWKPSTQTRHIAQSAQTLASQVLPSRSPVSQRGDYHGPQGIFIDLEAVSPETAQPRQRAAASPPLRSVVDHTARTAALEGRIAKLEAERAKLTTQLSQLDYSTALLQQKDKTIAELERASDDFDAVLSQERAQFKALAAAQDAHYTQRVLQLRSFHREETQQLLQQSARALAAIKAAYSSDKSACDEQLRAAKAAHREDLHILESQYQQEFNKLALQFDERTEALRESEHRLGQLEIFSESMGAELLAAQTENTQLRLSLAQLEQSHAAEAQALQDQHERDQESLQALTSLLDTHTVEQDRVSAENQEASRAEQTAALAKLSEAHEAELAQLREQHAAQISELQADSLASSQLTAALRAEVMRLQVRVETVTSASSHDEQAYETAIEQLAAQAQDLVQQVKEVEANSTASGAAANELLSRLQLKIAGLQDQISSLGVDKASLQDSNRSLGQEIIHLTKALASSKRQHEAEKDALCAQMIHLATETSSLMQTERAAHEKQLGALQKDLETLEVKHLEEIQALQARLEQLFEKKLSGREAQHQAKLAALSATLDAERKASEAAIAALQTRIISLSSTVEEQASEIADLRAQIALARSTAFQKDTVNAALSTQVSQLHADTAALTSQITASESARAQLSQTLSALHSELAALRLQSATQIDHLQATESDLSGQLERLSASLDTFKRQHHAQIAELEAQKQSASAKHAEEIASLSRAQAALQISHQALTDYYLDMLAKADQRYTSLGATARDTIVELQAELKAEKLAAQTAIAAFESQVAESKAVIAAQAKEIADLRAQIASALSAVCQKETDKAALSAQVSELHSETIALTSLISTSQETQSALTQDLLTLHEELAALRVQSATQVEELQQRELGLSSQLECLSATLETFKAENQERRSQLSQEIVALQAQKRSDDTAHADELASLSRAQAAERLSYTVLIQALEETLAETVAESASLDAASTDTITHLEAELATEKLVTQTEIAALEGQLAESKALLAAQAQQIESLDKEITALTAAKQESGANQLSLIQEISRLDAVRRLEVEKQSELQVKNFALQRDLACVKADYAQYKKEAELKRTALRTENDQLVSQIKQIRQEAVSFRDHCEATLEEKALEIAALTAQVEEGKTHLLPQLQTLERENQELRARLESTTTHLSAAETALKAAQKNTKLAKVKRFLVSLVHQKREKKQILESHIQLLAVLQSQTDFKSPSLERLNGVISERSLEGKPLTISDLDLLNKLSLSAIKEFFAHTSKELRAAEKAHDAEVLKLEERNLQLQHQLRELEVRNAQLDPAIAHFEADNAALQAELAAVKDKLSPYVQKIMSLERSAEQQAASTRLLQSENSKLQYKLEEAEGLRAAISGYDRLIKAQAERLKGLQQTVSAQERTILEIEESKATLAAEKARIEEESRIQVEKLLREKELLEAKHDRLHELLAADRIHSYKALQENKELEDRLAVISRELERLRRSYTSELIIPGPRELYTTAHTPIETISLIGGRLYELVRAFEELDSNHTSLSRRAAQRSERIEALTQELAELKESRDSFATILQGIFERLGGTSHDLLDRKEDESSIELAERVFYPLIEALKHSADSASESHADDPRRGSVESDPALNTSFASSLTGRASVLG